MGTNFSFRSRNKGCRPSSPKTSQEGKSIGCQWGNPVTLRPRRNQMRKVVVLFGAMLLALSTNAWSQDTANIVGTVTDSTGAVIPKAKVTISNPDRGFTRELVAESTGYFSLSAVPIDNYVVTAEAPGFQKLVRSGITLSVGQTQRIDMQLTVGQVTEQVSVTGNVQQVQTENATVS